MKYARIVNTMRDTTLGERVAIADTWWQRLRGLLGRPALQPGEGLLLTPCRAIHMAGMKYPLDVAFLDPQGLIVALYHRIAPGERTRWHASARSALELPAGTLKLTGTHLGDVVTCSTPAYGHEFVTAVHSASPTLSAS